MATLFGTTPETLLQALEASGFGLQTPMSSALPVLAPMLGWSTTDISSWLQQHGFSTDQTVEQVFGKVGLTGYESMDTTKSILQSYAGTPTTTAPTTTTPTTTTAPTTTTSPWTSTTPLGDIGVGTPYTMPPTTTTPTIPLTPTSGTVAPTMTGTTPSSFTSAGTFPQIAPISLPPNQQPTPFPTPPPVNLPPPPQPFQPVSLPPLPTQANIPPELLALFQNIQSTLGTQQGQRDAIMTQLQQRIEQQQAAATANQPMLDLALQNIQSVLSGQAASPSLQGLVNSAYAPAEEAAAQRLRQTAEEAAALRGMSLTDTPIGQPYLQQAAQLGETFGGQRAQALIGLRQQDAAFAQQVQQFQESLRQQALSNQMGLIQSMGTPEQAAQILSSLGLGARQAAISQFSAQGNQALSAADLALRQALGQSSAGLAQYAQQSQNALGLGGLNLQQALGQTQSGLANAQFGLTSQAQGFQQQLAQQQASIQNQLSLMGLLGDPLSAYNQFGTYGANQNQQLLNSLLGLSSSLLGQQPSFGTTGSTQTTTSTQPSNLLGSLGVGALGLSGLYGTLFK